MLRKQYYYTNAYINEMENEDEYPAADEFWVDRNNNAWSAEEYTKATALALSNSLTNCYNCYNCSHCEECLDCYCCDGCTACECCEDCVNCKDCEWCVESSKCSDSSFLHYCTSCTNCKECEDCNYCENLFNGTQEEGVDGEEIVNSI